MRPSSVRRAAVALLFAMLALLVPLNPAVAVEGDAEDTVNLNLDVFGATGTDSTSVPVLPGLVPVELRTSLTGGATLGPDGAYTLTVGDETVIINETNAAAITVPLSEDSVVDGFLTVTLTARFFDDLGCANVDISNDVVARVGEAVITYTGAPQNPTTPADFFSSAVRSITLVSEESQVPFTSAAMLQAAATLGTVYPRAEIATGDAEDSGPYSRILEFVPAAGPVVVTVDSVGDTPRMVLTGDAAALVPASAALESTDLALASESEVGELAQSGAPATSLSLRWSDVGGRNPRLEGLGTAAQSVTLSQTRFGGPISELEITIVGTYIPVPTEATASVSLLVNGRLLASERLGDGYTYSLTGTIKPEDMSRDNQVTVELEASPVGGDCRAAIWTPRVDIDATASTFTAQPGQTLPPGFERFPQVLGGQLPVAFAKGANPSDLSNAVDVVSSVSRLEVNAPVVSVVSVEEFLSSSTPGLLVDAGPEESTQLGAPLPFNPARAPVSTPPIFSVTVDKPFAAFEAFANGNRDLLMLGAFPAEDIERSAELQTLLAEAISPAPDGWYGLTGDVMFIGENPQTDADGDLEASFLAIKTPEVGEAVEVESTGDAVPTWLWVAGLLLGLLILIGFVLWLVSRGTRRSAESDEDSEAVSAPTGSDPTDSSQG